MPVKEFLDNLTNDNLGIASDLLIKINIIR